MVFFLLCSQILSSRKTRIKTHLEEEGGVLTVCLRYYPPEKQGLRLQVFFIFGFPQPSDTILHKD